MATIGLQSMNTFGVYCLQVGSLGIEKEDARVYVT